MRMFEVDVDHLEFGEILLVLVHFSPTKVSHARNNMIYPNDMIPIVSNQIYMSRIYFGCLIPSIIKVGLWILGLDKIAYDVS